MTRSSPPPLPPPVPDSNGAGGLAFDGAGAGFWTPVGLGVLGGMFGVVLAAGASVALQPGNGGASDSTAIVASESDNGGSPLTRFSGNRSDAASQAEGRDTRPLEPAGSSLPAGGLPGDTRQLPADSMEPVGPGGERRVPPASSGDGDDGGGVAAGRRENSALPSEPNTGQDTPQAGHDGASNDPRAEERNSPRVLDDVRAREGLLPIAGSAASGGPVDLCEIDVDSPTDLDLALAGNEFKDRNASVLELSRIEEDGTVLWTIEQRASSGLGRSVNVGEFELADRRLKYRPGASGSGLLPFCLLKITARAGGAIDSELCRLWKPLERQDFPLSFEGNRIEQPLIPSGLPPIPVESLTVSVTPEGFGDSDLPDGNVLAADQPVSIVVFDPELAGERLFSTRLSLEEKAQRPVLVASHTAEVKTVEVRSLKTTIEEEEIPFSRPGFEQIRKSASKEITAIENLIKRKIDPRIEKAEQALARLKALSNSASGRSTGSPSTALVKAERQLEEYEKTLDALDEAIFTLDDVIVWSEVAEQMGNRLERDARIGLKVIRETHDGHEVLILRRASAGAAE